MGAKRGVVEVPRQLRQLLRRIPVGHSSLYLNDLQPTSQQLFLTACMNNKPKDEGNAAGISIDRLEVSSHASLQALKAIGKETKNREGKTPQCNSVPTLRGMLSTLQLPSGSSGRLAAFRTLHPTLLTKPHIFLLTVPCWMFEDNGDNCTVESVLQSRLVQIRKTLYWREGDLPLEEDEEPTDIPEVMLEAIWGCTVPQVKKAAEIAESRDCRLFVISFTRQRLLGNEGAMVRELGSWYPSAFRSFQLDVRTLMPRDASTLDSAVTLLEEAQRGFAAKSIPKTTSTQQQNNSYSHNDNDSDSEALVEYAFPVAVAEAIVNVRRDAVVPYGNVCNDPLTARLFKALYDRRHFCVSDAVLYASQRVVLPFLLGLSPLSTSLSTSVLMRWSEIYTALRWRYFETAFGSLSQLVRSEDVTAVGGSLDPFILPLHDIFILRVLLPNMTEYHRTVCRGAVGTATVTVDILRCFNSLANARRHEFIGKHNKQQTLKTCVDESDYGDRPGSMYFTASDLPSLVKYLLYFHRYFEVQGGGTTVTFTPHED